MLVTTATVVRYTILDFSPAATYQIPFPYWDKETIYVTVLDSDGNKTSLSLGTDYTLSDATETEGLLTRIATEAWSNAVSLTIARELPLTQDADFVNGDTIDADELEQVFDEQEAKNQQIAEKLSRAITQPIEEDVTEQTELILPTRANRANQIIAFNEDGSQLIPVLTTDIEQKLQEALRAEENVIKLEGEAETSASNAKTSEGNAATSATNAKTSETNAKTSETNAKTSETNANTAQKKAEEAQAAAETAEDNAKASETAADESEALAKDWAVKTNGTVDGTEYSSKYHAQQAKTSETNAKASETNASDSASAAKTSETNAKASETASANSATAAKTSETNAKTSEGNAKTSETNAGNSATAASNSETLAKNWAVKTDGAVEGDEYSAKYHATNAKTSETNSKASETAAADSAKASADSATASANSATASANSASAAKTSETNAATSEGNAKTSETNAKTSEGNAKTSETNAANSASAADESEALAKDWATKTDGTVDGTEYSAKYHANQAKTSETNAKTSESNAKTSEGNAKTSETNSKTSETNAGNSATSASGSASAAAASATSAANSATLAGEYSDAAAKSAADAAAAVATVNGVVDGYLYNGTFYSDAAHTTAITPQANATYCDVSTTKRKLYVYRDSAFVEVSVGDTYTAGDGIDITNNVISTKPKAIAPTLTYTDITATVTMACATAGAEIYYTTDGTAPTTSSNHYTGPFTISRTTTFSIVAIADNTTYSDIATFTCTYVDAAAPSISCEANTVTITAASGLDIYYTTNGDTPTVNSTKYTGPFAITETVTVKAAAGGNGYHLSAVTSQECVYLPYVTLGVRITEATSDPDARVVYTEGAVGLTSEEVRQYILDTCRPVLFKDGQVQAYLNPDNFAQTTDGTAVDITSGDAGDVMIEFDRCSYTMSNNNGVIDILWSNNPDDDTLGQEGFMRGTTKKEHLYIGAYLGYNVSNALRSLSGKTPTTSVTIGNFRTYAQANGAPDGAGGSGYDLVGFRPLTYLQILFVLAYKSTNSQAALGNGIVNGSVTATGGTNASGMNYGTTANQTTHVKFMGIEDMWGNLLWFIDGIKTDASYNYLTANQGFNNDATGYDSETGPGGNPNNYFRYAKGNMGGGFMPRTTDTGSAATYYCDDGYVYATRFYAFGGDCGTATGAGVFCWYGCPASGASGFLGARLMYL